MQIRGLCDFTRHANIDQQRVVRRCNPLDRTDAVHMSLDEVPAQPIAGAQRAFQIDRPAFAPLPNQRTTERRGDGMNGEPALYDSLDRQASTVDGDALALLDATIPRLYPQFRAVVQRHRVYAANRVYDSGKHSRRSKTNNVSEPSARRSTTTQRGASASVKAGTPGKAGTAPSPSHTGAWIQNSRSTSPSVSSLVPSAPPPSHNNDWIPANRSCANACANACGRKTRTPLASRTATFAAGACGDATTHVGTSRAVSTSDTPWFSIALRSNTMRTGGRRGVTPPRAVSCGLSVRAVVPPTAMASKPARSQCTCSRASGPEIQCELPPASAMRPSIDVASFRATKGRSVCRRVDRNAAFCAAAASASTPISVSIPARFRISTPPRASRSGSRTAATTRRIPAARIASVHGGVLPWCAHGSSVTTRVAPRALSPAAFRALISACGPPNSACQPSPTTSFPRNSTAPTRGLGDTCPHPRHASSSARRIATASRSLSLFKAYRGCVRLAAGRANLADEPRLDIGALRPAHRGLDVFPRHDRDHPDPEVEDAPHLVATDLTAAHQHAKQRRPGPAARIDHRLGAGWQYAVQVPRNPSAGDVGKRMHAREYGLERRRITAVHREQRLRHGLVGLGKRVIDAQLHPIEHDLARERVPVRVQSGRRVADQLIARRYAIAVKRVVLFHHTDNRARQIVVTRRVQIGELRRFSAGERHVVRAATARNARHDLRRDLRDEIAGREIVEKGERPRTVHDNVIHRVVHEILADGVVHVGGRGDEHLAADPVRRHHEQRLLIAFGQTHHPAEAAPLAARERRPRVADEVGDAALGLVGRIETHPGRGVAVRWRRAHASSPSREKWTRSRNAFTRLRTSCSVTCSSRCTPNASTASDPIAEPYTIARRRLGNARSPVRATYPMKPPANASPAPVGSNTSCSG